MEQRNSQRNQETERSSTKRACASLGTELSDTPRISIPCSPGWRSSADDESELFEAMSSGVTGLQLAAGELPDSQPDVAVLITGISALSSSCFSSSPAWDMAGDGAALSSSPFLRATSTGRSLRMHLVVTGAQRPRRNYLDVIEPYIPYTMASANLAREPANDALASCVDDHAGTTYGMHSLARYQISIAAAPGAAGTKSAVAGFLAASMEKLLDRRFYERHCPRSHAPQRRRRQTRGL
ncbi:hypothetical protein TgHK011_003086 [Trichoderma gracile]|nr:hypothetical protein TgHK011_003086 [Trichoderma gracile]